MRWSHHFDTAELLIDGVSVNSTEIGGLYRKLDLHSTVSEVIRVIGMANWSLFFLSQVEIGGRPEEIGDEQVKERGKG